MKHSTLSIAVLSGKGGVGKSNIALNFCYGLHELASSVLLVDCDMGLANIDILLGLVPDHNIQDLLLTNTPLNDILIPISHEGPAAFDFLPANSGMANFTELDAGTRDILSENINSLASNYDFLVLDIGAGISVTNLSFSAMASMKLLVVTPEPTALTDSYAVMKIMSKQYQVTDFFILVNQVRSITEAQKTFSRLSSVCENFLGFTPHFLGALHEDPAVRNAVITQKILLKQAPTSQAARDLKAIIEKVFQVRNSKFQELQKIQPLRIGN